MTTTPVKTLPASDKKDVQKLQRAIVDGLEDVKAQDIQVFNTESLSPLFERVIVASGSSNRQTKALAASVRDAVREAGFGNPRVEGEDNGEWIIVDCGAAVAHIMQPTIRQYYHLEELWGDKPVKLKLGAAAPAAKKVALRQPASDVQVPARKKPGVRKAGKPAPAKKTVYSDKPVDANYIGRVGRTQDWTAKRNASDTAADAPAKPVAPARPPARRPPVKVIGKPAASKPAASRAATKKAPAKKVAAKKVAVKRAVPVKSAAKRPAARKTPAGR